MLQYTALKELVEGFKHFIAQRSKLMLEQQFPALSKLFSPGADYLVERRDARVTAGVLPLLGYFSLPGWYAHMKRSSSNCVKSCLLQND
jgi:hypothetical protein